MCKSEDMAEVDPAFTDLPLDSLAAAALEVVRAGGVEHGDVRIERLVSQSLHFRDASLESRADTEVLGLAVRVIKDGAWGFAATVDLNVEEAERVAHEALAMAQTAAKLTSKPVVLADELPHIAEWVSQYEIDPFSVDIAEKLALISSWNEQLLAEDICSFTTTSLLQYKENKFYCDLGGTRTTQQRVRLQCQLEAVHVGADGGFETMRTLAPPVGRGWEWMTGGPQTGNWDWGTEIGELANHLRERVSAPPVQAGRYDLVIHPSNLWLTIHESIGHATELDRALGYEAAYAGTSFATLDKLNTLQYGSECMHVTGDRTTPHGLSTIGFDDEGVETTSWDIIKDGTLRGYQLDRHMAHDNAEALGTERSNGCAFADSPMHVPVQRMANVSLQPDPHGPTTEELIARVDNGIYIVGDKSWSIDMQRYNFQFTGQRFYKIENGKLAGQLKDVAYQATTTDFWNSMEAVGGPQTFVLGGAFNCGKAQPGQVAAVSHGCPSALFRQVNVLNTTQEGAQ